MNGPRKPLPPVETAVSLTIAEAAALLRASVSAVRTLVRTKAIPSRRLGQEYRIHRDALIEWLRKGDRP